MHLLKFSIVYYIYSKTGKIRIRRIKMTTPVNPNPVMMPPMTYGKRDSTLAIFSLVAGLVGWTFLPLIGAITAVITGHLAKREIRESGGTIGGDGMALAGLIMGYVQIGLIVLGVILILTFAAVLIPAFRSSSNTISMLIPALG
jgi:hypothetical protein